MQISKYVFASAAAILLLGGSVLGAGLQHSLAGDAGTDAASGQGLAAAGSRSATVVEASVTRGERVPQAGRKSSGARDKTLLTAVSPGTRARPGRAPEIDDPRSVADYRRGLAAYQAGDYAATLIAWEAAAERGHLVAQWNLVRLYSTGNVVKPNPKRALYYLRAIAAKLDPNQPPSARTALKVAAYVELAKRYLEGVPEADLAASPERAFPLFELAATLYSHPSAQHFLGLMYLGGQGVKRDLGRAIRWLVLAARKRYGPSQAILGDIYWKDKNIGNNRARSLMWFSLAKENLRPDAYRQVVLDRYNTAKSEANDVERQQAMAMADSWRKKTGTMAAR